MKPRIKKGKQSRPQRTCAYGVEGVGKTELAATTPSPLFIDAEKGSSHIDVDRIEPSTMAEVKQAVAFLLNEDHDYLTCVIDTIDWVEKRMGEELCAKHNVDSIEKIENGFGKGYTMLEEEMMKFLVLLDQLRTKRGMHLVLLAHSKVQRYEDPELAHAYDRYQLKLEKKTSALIKEWVDALLFYNYITKVAEREGTMGSKRGVQGKERALRTCRTAAFDAKNRMDLPDVIPVTERYQLPVELAPLFNVSPAAAKAEKPERREEAAPDDKVDSAAELAKVIEQAGGEEAVNQFLAQRGKTVAELDNAYTMRILSNASAFIKQVKEFSAQ